MTVAVATAGGAKPGGAAKAMTPNTKARKIAKGRKRFDEMRAAREAASRVMLPAGARVIVRPTPEGVALDGLGFTRRSVASPASETRPGDARLAPIGDTRLVCAAASPLVRLRGLARLGVAPVLPRRDEAPDSVAVGFDPRGRAVRPARSPPCRYPSRYTAPPPPPLGVTTTYPGREPQYP